MEEETYPRGMVEGLFHCFTPSLDRNSLTNQMIPFCTHTVVQYIKEAFEAEDSWSETIESIKDEIEINSKIRPEKVTFVYYSADGNEIYKITQ